MVFLQTTCSKEQTQQLGDPSSKSTPVTLDRDMDDITDFKTAYADYEAGNPASFATLTLDDAEWLLEGAFNERHKLDASLENDVISVDYASVSSVSVDPATTASGDLVLGSDELFAAFETALSNASGVSDMLPMSDLEIVAVSGNFHLDIEVAVPYDRWHVPEPEAIAYEGNFASVNAGGGGPVPQYTCGNQYPSYYALEYNLALQLDPAAVAIVSNSPGKFYVNIKRHVFGDNPFTPGNYTGRNNNNYSGMIWGDPTDGFSNGSPVQCIDDNNTNPNLPSMTEYENWMKNTIIPGQKTSSLLDAFNIKIDPASIPDPTQQSLWSHHIFSFRTGFHLPR